MIFWLVARLQYAPLCNWLKINSHELPHEITWYLYVAQREKSLFELVTGCFCLMALSKAPVQYWWWWQWWIKVGCDKVTEKVAAWFLQQGHTLWTHTQSQNRQMVAMMITITANRYKFVCIWLKCVGEICFSLCTRVCLCVCWVRMALGRGKSFHFLDESLLHQKPRGLLLTPWKASLFLSSPSPPPCSSISAVHSAALCCHLPLSHFCPFRFFPPLSLIYFPSSPPTPSSSNYSSIAALQFPHFSVSQYSLALLFSPPHPKPLHPHTHTHTTRALPLQSQHFRSAVLCRQTSVLIYTFTACPRQF